MQAFYKTLTERQRSGMNVGAVIWKRSRGAARRLTKLLAPELREGEEMPDVELLQELLRRALERRREALADAGETLVGERSEVHELTAATGEAIAGARRQLIDLRTAFRGQFGTEKATDFLGVRGATSSDPLPLQKQIDRAIAGLRNAERPLPAQRIRLGPPDREELASGLDDRATTLRDTLSGLSLADKRVDLALAVKDKALKEWNDLFTKVARLFEAVYLLIGCDDWAREVRPSGHRKGRTFVDERRRRKKKPRKNQRRQADDAEAGAAVEPEREEASVALVVRRQEPARPAAVSGLRRVFEAFKPSRRAG